MLTKLWKFTLVITLFLVSIGLALFFSGRQFWVDQNLPLFAQLRAELINQVELYTALGEKKFKQIQQQFLQTKEDIKQSEGVQTLTGFIEQAGLDSKHRQNHQIPQYVCTDNALGEVKYKQVGGLYVWTDERGIKNISDQKPDNADAELIGGMTSDVLDFFELKLTAQGLPPEFEDQLKVKLNTVFRAYADLLGKNALKKVALNLTILPDRRSYEAAIKKMGSNPSGNVGMYFNQPNSAFIEYRGDINTMRTAVHEAVHAINNALIGSTARWLNEGLAEYFEFTQVILQQRIIHPNPSWVEDAKFNGNLLGPEQLFLTSNGWPASASSELYSSSWAVIYYLMDSAKGKQILTRYINAERKQPCDRFSGENSQAFFASRYPDFNDQLFQRMSQQIEAHKF